MEGEETESKEISPALVTGGGCKGEGWKMEEEELVGKGAAHPGESHPHIRVYLFCGQERASPGCEGLVDRTVRRLVGG